MFYSWIYHTLINYQQSNSYPKSVMEVHLKPSRLDTDPGSSQASQEWNHWYLTFDHFLNSTKAETDDDRYRLLMNFITPTVYSYISEHKNYVSAIQALRNLYDKTPNSIYARHILATTKQKPHQSLKEFLHELRKLSADCDYKPVNAEQYRSESIRDAYIAGMESNFIRQRLLEKETLTLDEAVTLSCTLDIAQKNADSYKSVSFQSATNAAVDTGWSGQGRGECDDPNLSAIKSKTKSFNRKPQPSFTPSYSAQSSSTCWFCGKERHPRSNCPARNHHCQKCGKLGHFAKLCNSSTESASALVFQNDYPRLTAVSAVNSGYSKVVLESVTVNGHVTEGLLDSGATDNFINEKFVDNKRFPVFPANFDVGLASGSHYSKVRGVCYVSLIVQGQQYENIKMSILKDLVKNVILGESFMNQHASVIFEFGGPKPSLVVSSLSPMDVKLPPMFTYLQNKAKPIAVKSRRYSLHTR